MDQPADTAAALEGRLAAAEAGLVRLEAAEGGNWRRQSRIGLTRRRVAGLKTRLAALRAPTPAARGSLPVPRDLLGCRHAIELSNSLGQQIRFSSETVAKVASLNPPSGRFPEGSVTVVYAEDGQRRTFDYRGLHSHLRGGTFRWRGPHQGDPGDE